MAPFCSANDPVTKQVTHLVAAVKPDMTACLSCGSAREDVLPSVQELHHMAESHRLCLAQQMQNANRPWLMHQTAAMILLLPNISKCHVSLQHPGG